MGDDAYEPGIGCMEQTQPGSHLRAYESCMLQLTCHFVRCCHHDSRAPVLDYQAALTLSAGNGFGLISYQPPAACVYHQQEGSSRGSWTH